MCNIPEWFWVYWLSSVFGVASRHFLGILFQLIDQLNLAWNVQKSAGAPPQLQLYNAFSSIPSWDSSKWGWRLLEVWVENLFLSSQVYDLFKMRCGELSVHSPRSHIHSNRCFSDQSTWIYLKQSAPPCVEGLRHQQISWSFLPCPSFPCVLLVNSYGWHATLIRGSPPSHICVAHRRFDEGRLCTDFCCQLGNFSFGSFQVWRH